jgi:undecaprenyl-diphosphatase
VSDRQNIVADGNPPLTALPGRTDDRTDDHTSADHAAAAWLVIALLSLVGFTLLTVAVAGGVAMPFDQSLLALAQTWAGWAVLWNVISQSANIPLIVIGLGFVLWLFLTKRRREAALVLVVLVAVTAGSEAIKQLVARPRPSGNGDGIPGVVFSYPSGHVLEVLTILGIVAIRFWRTSYPLRLRWALVVVVAIEVILVGFARLALNEHYPSDLLGGFLAAIGALGLYAWLTRPGAWADQSTAEPEKTRAAP